jgi:hypothetical protein
MMAIDLTELVDRQVSREPANGVKIVKPVAGSATA